MSNVEHIKPGVVIDGKTVYPAGYVWVLAFAFGGCQWAIDEANKPEFREMVKADLKAKRSASLHRAIAEHEAAIERIRKEIADL